MNQLAETLRIERFVAPDGQVTDLLWNGDLLVCKMRVLEAGEDVDYDLQ